MAFEWVRDITPSQEMTEGPYYGYGGPRRSDLREDVEGTTFQLAIKVVNVADGSALEGLVVDLWHCDPRGRYSGYDFDPDKQPESVEYQMPNAAGTALRGSQVSGRDGIVQFSTIFPGWYATRTPHLHVKVFDGKICILTTQLYLSDAFTREFYKREEIYKREAQRDTFNGTDIVLGKTPGSIDSCWVELKQGQDRIFGEAVLVVDRTARSQRKPIPPGFRPPLGGLPHEKPVR
ncbi:hypothetical protein [Bradyrhizobium sp. WSM2254]|uniref:dioxygenase family protein n=1 Tax=Bradyrhizobium sp. WSM2254 TaxID=1188263 RepID=UPI000676786D|nr:hypothetical protein [Bradyrhizobium sp. WSM2254]